MAIEGMPSAPTFLREQNAPRTVVLLYHRVADLVRDPQLSAVSIQNFTDHLQVIAGKYQTARVADLARSGVEAKARFNRVVVTFDDGYVDNFENAFPLLERNGIFATMFVTTGMVEHRSEFWWDSLYRILFESESLPDKLSIQLEKNYEWNLDGVTPGACDLSADWNLLCSSDPGKLHEIYRTVCAFMRTASAAERAKVLDELTELAPNRVSASACYSMTAQNILDMSKSGFVEIGSHGVNHHVLSALSIEEQRHELEVSRNFLKDITNLDITSLAYPYGTKSDYSKDTIEVAANVGYSVAASNIAEVVWPGTSRYEIPRLLVRDCDGESFAQWLGEWFGE